MAAIKNSMKKLFTILFILCAIIAQSETYYVATTGSDSNPGTSALPFLTIQKGIDEATAGDSIIVNDGTYVEGNTTFGLLINKSGTLGSEIVLKSKNQFLAILDGENNSEYGIILYAGASYVKIEGFEIKNYSKQGIIYNQPEISSYVTIQGNKIRDIGRYETSDAYGLDGIYFKNKSHHWTITRNIIYNIGRTGPDTFWMNKDHAVYVGDTDTPENAAHHNIISYNIIWGISGSAITTGGNYDQIVNNVFAWTNENSQGGSCFIVPDSNVSDLLIANNQFYQPPVSNPYAIAPLGTIIRWTVKNNMVYGGRMWVSSSSQTYASMAGGNYGKTDCENAEVNPLFTSAIIANVPNVDFSLQAASPAIDKGVDVGLTSDFLGNPLINLPDIGAYEYINPIVEGDTTEYLTFIYNQPKSLNYTLGIHIKPVNTTGTLTVNAFLQTSNNNTDWYEYGSGVKINNAGAAINYSWMLTDTPFKYYRIKLVSTGSGTCHYDGSLIIKKKVL